MTNDTNVSELPVGDIKVDPACQARVAKNETIIDEYARRMKQDSDDNFPAVVVFHDGTNHWLSDGFHRHAAAEKAGLHSLKADIREGSRREAILHAVGANATHGLRRTRKDKRRAVNILLEDQEWSEWSNRKIADCCSVDEKLVRTLRSASAAKPQIARKFERNGTVSKMDTSDIGRKDGLEELLSIEPDRDKQPGQGWFAAPETAAADDSTAEILGDERQPPSDPVGSSDEVQLRELMSAWGRASGEVRQQFLANIGVSPSPQAEAGRGLTGPEPSQESDPSQKQELSVMSSATELPEKLFEMWMGLNGHTKTYGRIWVETGCPAAYHACENPYITDKLVPFRAAVCAATKEQQQQLSELLK
jgi:hypothetical protein